MVSGKHHRCNKFRLIFWRSVSGPSDLGCCFLQSNWLFGVAFSCYTPWTKRAIAEVQLFRRLYLSICLRNWRSEVNNLSAAVQGNLGCRLGKILIAGDDAWRMTEVRLLMTENSVFSVTSFLIATFFMKNCTILCVILSCALISLISHGCVTLWSACKLKTMASAALLECFQCSRLVL